MGRLSLAACAAWARRAVLLRAPCAIIGGAQHMAPRAGPVCARARHLRASGPRPVRACGRCAGERLRDRRRRAAAAGRGGLASAGGNAPAATRARDARFAGLHGRNTQKKEASPDFIYSYYARALTFQIVLQEDRIAAVAPKLLEGIDSGPGAVAVVDNVLGPEWCEAMRREAIAVTERGLMKGKLVY